MRSVRVHTLLTHQSPPGRPRNSHACKPQVQTSTLMWDPTTCDHPRHHQTPRPERTGGYGSPRLQQGIWYRSPSMPTEQSGILRDHRQSSELDWCIPDIEDLECDDRGPPFKRILCGVRSPLRHSTRTPPVPDFCVRPTKRSRPPYAGMLLRWWLCHISPNLKLGGSAAPAPGRSQCSLQMGTMLGHAFQRQEVQHHEHWECD